ncbi:MAG: chemotaxis protein CheB [Pseudomonadota bacterium]
MNAAATPGPGKTHPQRVVIVDDSLSMRRLLHGIIDRDPRMNVVGLAATADEARATIKATVPDVVTLDLEMPGMNGLEFLARLMRLHPLPVVVLSAVLDDNGELKRKAMSLGAAACIRKPHLPTPKSLAQMCDCIVAAAQKVSYGDHAQLEPAAQGRWREQIMLVGASTGGVAAIETLLRTVPDDGPPIVIAQHMPHGFLTGFVQRLDSSLPRPVRFARHGLLLAAGDVVLAPSRGQQTQVMFADHGIWMTMMTDDSDDQEYCPSVDTLFHSAVPWADRVGAAVLTGLGRDGAQGVLALHRNGARTVGQSQRTCAVYGMPSAAQAIGGSETEHDIEVIGPSLLDMMAQSRRARFQS